MKKILFTTLALAAFAACNTDEVLSLPEGPAIEFDQAFVENATKAATDLSKANLNDFGVYGSVENQSGLGMIFENIKVTKSGDAYTYSPAQYWVGGATYNFVSFAPYTNARWSYETTDAKNGTLTFDNEVAAGEQDLLFASAQRTTPASITAAPGAVALTFNHMLSRVKFTFTNGFAEGSNIDLKVTDVTITNAHKVGELVLSNGSAASTWTVADNADAANVFARLFGDLNNTLKENGGAGSTAHYYLIPAEASYIVTFNIELFQAGVSVDNYARQAVVELDMEQGTSYNVKAILNEKNTSDDGELYPIEFTVNTVEEWIDWSDVNAETSYAVSTAADLVAAAAKGGKIVMLNDIALSETLVLSTDAVLDGMGNTLSSTASRAINVSGTQNVTIKDLTVNCTGERGINLIQNANNVVLENVNVTAANYAVNVAGSAAGAKVTIADSELKGLNVVNIAASDVLAELTGTKLTCNDQADVEKYAAIMINNDATNSKAIATDCEFVVYGDSSAGSYSAEGASVELINCTGSNKINHSKFAIHYPTGQSYVCETLEGLLPVVKDGETITLINNAELTETLVIPSGKNFTFDLNGYTLSAESAADAHNTMISLSAGASMTIADSKGNGKISYTYNGAGDSSFGWGSYAVENRGGNLTIANGTIEMLCDLNTPAGNVHMYCAVQNYSGSTVVNGGTLSCHTYRSLRVNNGSVTFNGGVMEGQVWMHPFSENTSITINGGTFAPKGNDGSSVYVENGSKTVNMNITGGTFTTKIGCAVPTKAGAAGTVKGGTFTTSAKENTNAALIANGYEFVQSGANWLLQAK